MEMNRHHYFLVGLIVLYLGLQFRMIDAFVLNEDATKFITTQFGSATEQASADMLDALVGQEAAPRKTVRPPEWLGWAMISVGSVLILHALSMRRPGGGD